MGEHADLSDSKGVRRGGIEEGVFVSAEAWWRAGPRVVLQVHLRVLHPCASSSEQPPNPQAEGMGGRS
ncbi:hypothetical protein cyc_08893 [Cyclospora cayetanensis]|uniref:Uncharacterized protein n=1 Tax=Cyclospora cayetanensis TaxID=88456 RepID=A0A1D3D2C8_9EIME|nr:hypothetical protein cyc_08893 [Cyclospora cayetanensis]